jgi:acetyl-CoA C-acetyltransferase
MTLAPAFIVAARRTALGRVGGLHRRRRIEDLAAPVITAVLEDAGLGTERVGEVLLGNTTAGGNAARLAALAAGLPETVAAATIDRQCASGLDAILQGARLVATGEADVVAAGGAEALSTAPWRIIKPRTVYQLPRFEGPSAIEEVNGEGTLEARASALLATELQLTRDTLDAYALRTHIKAFLAHEAKRFVGEIVPLKLSADEMRDESLDGDLSIDDLTDLAPYDCEEGRMTSGNTSRPHDGAAFAVVVSEKVWRELGLKPALKVAASLARGVEPAREAFAPIDTLRALGQKLNGSAPPKLALVETSETSAAQAIALRDVLGLEDDALNPDGGAIARGHAGGASGAVLVARLFTRMVRQRKADSPKQGIAVQGARGGLGVAALFEAV